MLPGEVDLLVEQRCHILFGRASTHHEREGPSRHQVSLDADLAGLPGIPESLRRELVRAPQVADEPLDYAGGEKGPSKASRVSQLPPDA